MTRAEIATLLRETVPYTIRPVFKEELQQELLKFFQLHTKEKHVKDSENDARDQRAQ